MKKIAILAGSIALFVAAILPVAAAGNECSNGTTGPFATNYCNINNTSNVTVNNVNDAQIVNNVTARVNSGGNSASYNTLGGSVTTGNATLNATVSSVANVNTTNVSGGPSASGNSGSNNITGPDSDNRVNITNTYRVNVLNSNTATVDNNVNATADAGNNRADFNTGPGSVYTGSAGLNLSLLNHVNDNATGISVGGGETGGTYGANDTTGPMSTNYVDVLNSSNVRVNNVNDMIVDNRVDMLANTGRNSASYNTLGGEVRTGNALAGLGLNTEGNINTTTVELAMGGFTNGGSNDVTGPFSDNRTSLVNQQNTVVDNWNNKCRSHNADRLGEDGCDPSDLGVFNYDNDVADAGSNASNYNTGGGLISAGWADLFKSILTHLNDTLTVIQQ